MEILYIVLGCIIGCILIYFILKPKITQTEKLDEALAKQNEVALHVKEKLEEEIHTLDKEASALKERYYETYYEVGSLQAQRKELHESIEEMKNTSEQYYNTLMDSVVDKFETSATAAGKKYQDAERAYQDEYSRALEECVCEFQGAIEANKKELAELRTTLANARKVVDAAVEANKRAEEIKEKENFFKLNLLKEDLEEIDKLREVVPYLRDATPLYKVIWKCYYEKPYTDLVGRIVGDKPITGIYKITNTTNGMCYVGQAVNIAERWRQHIKRGIGAEPPTRNKLYPAMASIGVENFTFEIVEKCPAAELNEKEDAWQEYFHAKDFGYSIK